MIRVADYIVHFLVNYGVRHIFMLTGGGAMHLNDAIGREKRLQYICNHHEQACAIAAEGYARISGLPGVVCVTTGPGGTNAMTGVLGEWLDSIPVLYLSGQVRYDTTVASTGLPLRQFGDQEANIIELVRPITKYAEMVIDPLSIRFHLEKALYLALHGRPGPVWLDIPLNIQAAIIDEYNLTPYHFDESQTDYDEQAVANQIQLLFQKIAAAERPVILAGAGIRLANAAQDFFELAEKLNIPVQAAWDAIDLFPSDHPLYAGRPSTLGQRGANFIFQNSDLLISIGCRLNTRQIGYTFAAVARSAYKVSVDVDENELIKPSIKIDMPVHADAGFFIRQMLAESEKHIIPVKNDWLDWCRKRQLRYPTVVPHNKRRSKFVDPYIFSETLSKQLQPDDIIVSSNGASCVIPIQALQIQHGQRHVVNSGCAAMGYGLPAAVGACFANNQKRVICFEGDGSIQLNIQELQTVFYHHLPIKIFVFSNGGYLSIHTTQKNFFEGNWVGESEISGVGFPDFVRLARAYGIKAVKIKRQKGMKKNIARILAMEGPVLCDVNMDPEQLFEPRITSKKLPDGRMVSSPLEDMFPFLDEDEFLSNMIIPRWMA